MAMGGVGEAMLLGAAMGGGSAALTGGDPLKGALLGGLTGGAGAGISGALTSALNPAVSLATTAPAAAASSMAPTVANAAALNSAASAIPAATTSVAPAAASSIAPAAASSVAPTAGTLGSGTFGIMPPATSGGIADLFTKAGANPAVSAAVPTAPTTGGTFMEGMKRFTDDPIASIMRNKPTAISSAISGATGSKKKPEEPEEYDGPLKRFRFNPSSYQPAMYAEGGIADLSGSYDRMVGEQPMYQAMARGGISDLGSYSDYARGGRMLKGPGDGMSDSIPASIAGKRPARLADGEFVIPADVVSHLGNGSTDAGAKQLYAMMNKVRQARTGRKAQGREINPRQYMAA